ncbi:MAG TPA: hypothetical protein VNI61_00995 [Gemmatimonadales bacterium]|nr:hypothetical protein [Gemmatimonadales bacterium]
MGVLTLFARSVEGSYVARPEGLFALAGRPPVGDSRSTGDTCQVGDFVPQSTNVSVIHVDAGDSILFVAGPTTAVLRPIRRFGVTIYAANPPDVPIVPGSEVTFSLAGAPRGFPATTISSLTAPALQALSPIPARPPTDQPLSVTWEPVGDDSSRVEVLLIYARQGSTAFNEQVVCDWRDDGNGTIRPELLGAWALSELQRVEVSRYRTQRREMGDTVLFLLATFDTVPPVVP